MRNSEPTEVQQLADEEPSQHQVELQDHRSGDIAPRPSLMGLYHEIIQLAVKAQLDADRRDVVREQREREERRGALERQQKMMSLIAALIESKQT
ncbi:hypothetical protein PF005_g3755 [Phytophthora fragariae]|uniref:Uncharacterized protein n=1 Tax=Phytophthora fragariae TaxID=53985 RepID=A0A6A4A4Q2_9STRA|nr:hypothetical protein PF009_g2800 [Phytophthora fragariae]KAE9131634.1 hypothetical protein PF010_g3450 [Phytophthora fragariae]KAE9226664.1 hypothetical protein PF004_g11577 [Phytophthora fragariae]KAE9229749.1 hypothetical protein PF005_g3755 [Phytophthora fragariae]KAE9251686.1 hypothetical protein PF002_g4172 [Phytophthora fragariae]